MRCRLRCGRMCFLIVAELRPRFRQIDIRRRIFGRVRDRLKQFIARIELPTSGPQPGAVKS